jgi:hypothetical protein
MLRFVVLAVPIQKSRNLLYSWTQANTTAGFAKSKVDQSQRFLGKHHLILQQNGRA